MIAKKVKKSTNTKVEVRGDWIIARMEFRGKEFFDFELDILESNPTKVGGSYDEFKELLEIVDECKKIIEKGFIGEEVDVTTKLTPVEKTTCAGVSVNEVAEERIKERRAEAIRRNKEGKPVLFGINMKAMKEDLCPECLEDISSIMEAVIDPDISVDELQKRIDKFMRRINA